MKNPFSFYGSLPSALRPPLNESPLLDCRPHSADRFVSEVDRARADSALCDLEIWRLRIDFTSHATDMFAAMNMIDSVAAQMIKDVLHGVYDDEISRTTLPLIVQL